MYYTNKIEKEKKQVAKLTKKVSAELRAAIQAAVDEDIITPSGVLEYLEDNGFAPMTTRMTVISILKECGVVYVWGRWERSRSK